MNEILSVANVLPVLQTAADQLQSLISAKEKALKKAPAGRLRLSRRKNQVQWFHVTKGTTVHGKYIPVNEIGRAKALAQKEYDLKALPELKKWRLLIDSFLNRNKQISADGAQRSALESKHIGQQHKTNTNSCDS